MARKNDKVDTGAETPAPGIGDNLPADRLDLSDLIVGSGNDRKLSDNPLIGEIKSRYELAGTGQASREVAMSGLAVVKAAADAFKFASEKVDLHPDLMLSAYARSKFKPNAKKPQQVQFANDMDRIGWLVDTIMVDTVVKAWLNQRAATDADFRKYALPKTEGGSPVPKHLEAQYGNANQQYRTQVRLARAACYLGPVIDILHDITAQPTTMAFGGANGYGKAVTEVREYLESEVQQGNLVTRDEMAELLSGMLGKKKAVVEKTVSEKIDGLWKSLTRAATVLAAELDKAAADATTGVTKAHVDWFKSQRGTFIGNGDAFPWDDAKTPGILRKATASEPTAAETEAAKLAALNEADKAENAKS